MGCKRPFEEMEFEELCFKHPRQLEYGNKPASFSEFVSRYSTPQDLPILDKDGGGSCKFEQSEMPDKDSHVKISPLEKDSVTGNPLSLMTNGTGEEDTSFGPFEGVARTHRSSGYFDKFNFPRRSFVPIEDAYLSSMNSSPRRHVPVGPNYQACIPVWRGSADEEKADLPEMLESEGVESCNEERLMGTCIIPMPDSNLSTQESGRVGIGRSECFCVDAGSIRCVRQHVKESRENMRKSLGEKKFVNLGFYQMGEEVSHKWSEDEELDFEEVVYSNPVSLGRKFWNRLSAVFPLRSKKEIVSYYFNVFMLRKRASQNRSRSLDIDSDDDEWHGSNGGSSEIQDEEDEEDSAIDSVGDRHPHTEGLSEEESEDNDHTDGSDDCDDDIGQHREHATEEYGVVDQVSKSFVPSSAEKCRFDSADGMSDHFQGDCVFQDDSCMSFESQAAMSGSCGPVDDGAAFKLSELETENVKCQHSKPGLGDNLYLSDTYDSKVWDARFNDSRPEKNFDLLPWDMIEDIFGDGKDDAN